MLQTAYPLGKANWTVKIMLNYFRPHVACCLQPFAVALMLSYSASPVYAQQSGGLPDWLYVGFEQQSRIQFLDGQFRNGLEGSDQGFEWRNLLKAEANFERFSLTAELADMSDRLASVMNVT